MWWLVRCPGRAIVEEMVLGPDGGLPDDLRFYVFNGGCRIVRSAVRVVWQSKTIGEVGPDWTPIDAIFVDDRSTVSWIPASVVRTSLTLIEVPACGCAGS